jgi:hypothetical protein
MATHRLLTLFSLNAVTAAGVCGSGTPMRHVLQRKPVDSDLPPPPK